MPREFTCNKWKCEETYTKYDVRNTKYCEKHQPDNVFGAGVIF